VRGGGEELLFSPKPSTHLPCLFFICLFHVYFHHQIGEKLAIPPNKQQLIFNENQMKNSFSLAHYNTPAGAAIYMSVKKRGRR
jgi:hypothetical protein